MSKNRLDWTDTDWAKYLNCPIQDIPKFRKILESNFVMVAERNKKTGKYSFAMYRYYVTPSGWDRFQLQYSGKRKFDNIKEATSDANGIISQMELNKFWSESLRVPKQAIQMLLIREK